METEESVKRTKSKDSKAKDVENGEEPQLR